MIEISQLRKLFKGPEIISHKYFDQLTDDLITRAHHPLAKLKKESYNLIPSAVLVPIIYEEWQCYFYWRWFIIFLYFN